MRKRGAYFCGFVAAAFLLVAGAAEASVELTPRVRLGSVAGGEDYFLFGKYAHARLAERDGNNRRRVQAVDATPVLWRTMSVNGNRATVLAHYLLDVMAYQFVHDNTTYRRPDGQMSSVWAGSEVQRWLNSDTADIGIYSATAGQSDAHPINIKGFLHADYFTAQERTAMAPYASGAKVALPSWDYDNGVTNGELQEWFADNTDRKADFKGDSASWEYWTRSQVFPNSNPAFVDYVNTNGGQDWDWPQIGVRGVRPCLLLDLSAFVLKLPISAVQTSISGAAGSMQNPYILVFPSGNGYGLKDPTKSDKKPASAFLTGNKLVLSWDVPVFPYSGYYPRSEDFKLTVGGSSVSPTSVAEGSPGKLALTFAQAPSAGTVLLSYNLNCGAVAFGDPLTVVDSFLDFPVTRDTGNSTDPKNPNNSGPVTPEKKTGKDGGGCDLGLFGPALLFAIAPSAIVRNKKQ